MNIDFNELLQYYDIENHSAQQTAEHFNVSVSKIMTELKKHNFHKNKSKHVANIKKSKKEHFGDENYNNRQSSKETCLKKYGIDNPFKDIDKIKNSYIKKFGVDHPMKNKDVCDKVVSKKDYSKEALKRKQTIIAKYRDEKQFNSNKSQAAWEAKHNSILEKTYITKKKNNSFNSSSVEELAYNYLCGVFDKKDIMREYSDNRYPYRCDFYIKSRDLFIELNLHWSHGKHLFDSKNKKDLETLKEWKEKSISSEFYKNAIETWTIRDVSKNKCAVSNKLNYLAIYSLNELYEVFKNE